MSDDVAAKLAALVGPALAPLTPAERPAVIALAERIAAGRYRAWSQEIDHDPVRNRLLACAAREEDIATRVEAVTPDAAALQGRALAEHADLPQRYAALFSGLDLPAQFALQARAERAGAATWRALASANAGPTAATFLSCAELEEASAAELEALIAEGVGA